MGKHLSGAQKRRKEMRDADTVKQSQNMAAWLKRKVPQDKNVNSVNEQIAAADKNNIINEDDYEEMIIELNPIYLLEQCNDALSEATETIDTADIDRNNPSTWPQIDHSLRYFLISNGIDQGKDCDLSQSIGEDGRKFTCNWFTKKLTNGEILDRKWLMYSTATRKIYCFPCILFQKSVQRTKKLTDPKEGFNNWRYLYPRIGEHENSIQHRNNHLKWIQMEKCIITGGSLNEHHDKAIMIANKNWPSILKVMVDVILLCARKNFTLRGQIDLISDPNCGNFFSILKLISHYHPELEDYINNYEPDAVSGLFNNVQGELINLLGNKVRTTIIEKVKVAKYYSIQLHEAHDHRITPLSLRYVDIEDGVVDIRESFVDFIKIREKTEEEIAKEILSTISTYELDIHNVRGQTYAQHKNVQDHILQENSFARFVPSSAHSLYLCGEHAAKISPFMITFFGIVDELFVFFSRSVKQWEMLMSALKISLKVHSDTRWFSKVMAVNALNTQISDVYDVLEEIAKFSADKETQYKANNFLNQIDFTFLMCLSYWDLIQSSIDRVNTLLQTKSTCLLNAIENLNDLMGTLTDINDNKKEEMISIATENSKILNISDDFNEKQLFFKQIEAIFKMLHEHLKPIYEELANVNMDFDFLTTKKLVKCDLRDLEQAAIDLSQKYYCDLKKQDFCSEISSFKLQVANHFQQHFPGPQKLLQFIYDFEMKESFPNIEIALRIFLSMSVTPASCDTFSSKVKLIKRYVNSELGREDLPNLSILSIEADLAETISFDEIIEEYAALQEK